MVLVVSSIPNTGNNGLSNNYHRTWCTLAVSANWVGHSGVTSVQFGLSVSSGLWLLGIVAGAHSALPILSMATSPMLTLSLLFTIGHAA